MAGVLNVFPATFWTKVDAISRYRHEGVNILLRSLYLKIYININMSHMSWLIRDLQADREVRKT